MAIEFPTSTVPWLFLLGYFVAGVISTAFAIYVVRFRWAQPAPRAFGILSIVIAIWTFAYIGRLLSPSLSTKLLWTQLAWVGITITPIAVFAFVLIFTGRGHIVTRKVVGGLLVLPILTQVMLWTNDTHSLLYQDVWLYTGDSIPIIASRGGTWFYGVHIPYAWGLFFIATVLLIQFAFTTRQFYRTQVAALVFGAIFPWFVNGTFLAGIRLHPELDPTPIGVGLGMFAIAIAVFRVDFLGVIPLAREKVFDEIDECIFVLDEDDRVIDVNDAGERFLDAYTTTRWSVGDSAHEVFPRTLDEGVFAREEDRSGTEVCLSVDGREEWYLLRRYRLGEPEHQGQIVSLTDISAQKHQQTELERSNAQLEQVAGVMSHDLRNPLSVASGAVRRVEHELERLSLPDAERDDLASLIEQAADSHDRMAGIIEDVLLLARSGDLDLETTPIDVENVARVAWGYVQTGEVELVIEDTRTFSGDMNWLLQVFENLFRNTVDHGETATTVWVGADGDGIFVEDDGVGIPADRRDAIFERGVTGDTNGTGIGLSIVRNIVAAHGWGIAVTERTGGGTRFEMTGVVFEDGEE